LDEFQMLDLAFHLPSAIDLLHQFASDTL